MRDRKIWLNGAILAPSEAKVCVLSPTAQFGLNVFEGIRCYWNGRARQLYAFRLREHFSRLADSCRLASIPCPYSADELRRHLVEIVRANDLREDAAVRMTIFVDGEGSWSAEGPAGMFIAPIARPRTPLPVTQGKRACVSSWQRIDDNALPPRIKAGANYVSGRYAHLEAKRNGYDLPLLVDRAGHVAEGAGACLFLVRHGELVTPPLGAPILESITRATIIEYAGDLKAAVVERDIARTELYLADEVFLCGSAAELTPVTSIDTLAVGDGRPGALTQRLLERYLAIVSGEEPRYRHWLTPIYDD